MELKDSICRYVGSDGNLYFLVGDLSIARNCGGVEDEDGVDGHVVEVVELDGQVDEEIRA